MTTMTVCYNYDDDVGTVRLSSCMLMIYDNVDVDGLVWHCFAYRCFGSCMNCFDLMSLIAFIRITMTLTMALFGSDDGASAQSDDGASAQYALFGIIMATFGTTCIVSSRSHCIII